MVRYFDEVWPDEEKILDIGLKMSRQNKKDRQKMNRAYCIGNGESRKGFDLERLRKTGKIFGCNALHREFLPDVLTAVDHGIMHEVYHAAPYRPRAVAGRPDFVRRPGLAMLRAMRDTPAPDQQ